MTTGTVICAGQDVTDRVGIAQLHGMTWRRARRAQLWAAPGHPKPITTDRPTHGRPQLWDLAQARAFANGLPIPALPQGIDPHDLLDRFAAAEVADVNPVTWASDTYDGRIPEPDETIHGGSWWYRLTVENYLEQRARPHPPSQQRGRPTGRVEPVPRGQIRTQVAVLVAKFHEADERINIADIARRLGIHYTTALHHVHAITAEQPNESGSTARKTTTSPNRCNDRSQRGYSVPGECAERDRLFMQWRLITPGVVLVVGCGIPTAIGYVQVADQNRAAHAADARGAEQLQLARELPASPPDVAVALTEFIGEGGPNPDAVACLLFSTTAAGQLAATMDTASCPAAIQAMHDQVADRRTYINGVTIPADTWSATGDIGSLNGCAVTWNGLLVEEPATRPGPLLGYLTLTRQDDKGWLITGYRGC